MNPSQAAKLFEGQLASALVAEDGQLALSNLAQSAAHAVMPKLQPQGQLGQARSVLFCIVVTFSLACLLCVIRFCRLRLTLVTRLFCQLMTWGSLGEK